jgi:hypothetical protein
VVTETPAIETTLALTQKPIRVTNGRVASIFRRIEGGVVHSYQVKSNSVSSIIITQLTANTYKAEIIYTGGNLKDLTKNSATVASSLTVKVVVYDLGEPGSGVDKIYYDIKGGSTLWYTTATSGSADLVTKGNIQVHTQGGPTPSTEMVVDAATAIQSLSSNLTVSTFPNPYTDKVKFVIQTPVSGQASLEVFNMLGQRVQTVFKGHLEAGRGQSFEYNVPQAIRGNLMYILRVGDQKATGKLIHPN